MQEQNPWWIGEKDYSYEKWKGYDVKWIPNIIEKIEPKPFSLYFLVGPRQVGKTTAIKIYIQKLLENRDPKSIFYYSCDELADYKELGETLDNYDSAREEWKIDKSIIFLDEVTFVDEWWRSVKARIDRGMFKNDVLIITGSATMELLKQKEYFPGRRGHGKDINFLPMDFREYIEKFGDFELKSVPINQTEKIENTMNANKIYSKKIQELFLKYLKTGGFPIPIRELFELGDISVNSKRTYLNWLKGDWKKIGKSDKYMKEIISYILRKRLSPISWLNISRETSINSPHTTRSYVESLENLFAIKSLNLISPDFKVFYRKNKKIHVSDPFLYHVLSYYTKEEVLPETMVESVLASHLSRVSDTYFWRNRTEVDVVSVINGEQIGFEAKWGFRTWEKPRHLKKTFLLTKEKLSLFLSSISWD